MTENQSKKETFKPPPYKIVKTITSGAYAAIIMRQGLSYPKFSYELGRCLSGKFQRFLVPTVRTHNSVVALIDNRTELVDLIGWVEAYIWTELQAYEDKIMELRQVKEIKQSNLGKPEFRHTGKTENTRKKKSND